jgi:4'-phosphopantetheinyl transferase
MPLLKLQALSPHSMWALWKIDEQAPDSLSQLNCTAEELEYYYSITAPKRRQEWLAGRLALQEIVQTMHIPYEGLLKEKTGKPYLPGSAAEVSISHSYPYGAALLHTQLAAGIDLEALKPKLLTLAPRFLSEQELAIAGNNLHKTAVCWCTKEVLYKIYYKKNLILRKDLEILPFNLQMEGFLIGIIKKNEVKSQVHTIKYFCFENFIVAFNTDPTYT